MKSIVAVLFASLALVACGKKEEAPVAPATTTAPATTEAPAPATTEPAKAEEAKK